MFVRGTRVRMCTSPVYLPVAFTCVSVELDDKERSRPNATFSTCRPSTPSPRRRSPRRRAEATRGSSSTCTSSGSCARDASRRALIEACRRRDLFRGTFSCSECCCARARANLYVYVHRDTTCHSTQVSTNGNAPLAVRAPVNQLILLVQGF